MFKKENNPEQDYIDAHVQMLVNAANTIELLIIQDPTSDKSKAIIEFFDALDQGTTY